MKLQVRPIRPEDHGFLCDVYASTRWDELAVTNWTDDQKLAFLKMQFNAQHWHYHQHYGDADFLLILLGEQPIGRLYLARWPDEYRLIDIALLPNHRNKGIGSKILRDLLAEADAHEKPVRIHVEHFNPARALYLRLGFVPIRETGVYCFMERPVPMAAI